MMLRVDIRTVVVDSRARSWRLFPGEDYKFLDHFRDQEMVFLDLPGLDLPPSSELGENQDLLSRVAAVQSTKDNFKRDRDSAIAADPSDFEDARTSQARGRMRRSILNLHKEAARDDLIVVPDTLSAGRVLVGRFTKGPRQREWAYYPKKYGSLKIPARSVQWLDSIAEQKLSIPLSKSLRQQHPVTLLERSFLPEVLSLAYKNFAYSELFSAVVYNRNDDFTDKDAGLISFISRVAAQYTEATIEGGEATLDNLFSTILTGGNFDYTCSIATDIHSEGFTRFLGAKPTALVIVATLTVLAALSQLPPDQITAAAQDVQIFNSLAPADDSCGPPVSEATRRIIAGFGDDRLIEACRAMREAQHRAGLESGMQAIENLGVPTPMPRPNLFD